MFCAFHDGRIAGESCYRCGVGICDECQTLIKARCYCPSCSALVGQGEETVSAKSPLLAAALSAVFPGMGQAYNGQLGKAVLIFITAILVVPWIYGIYDAYQDARRIQRQELALADVALSLPACLVLMVMIAVTPFFARKAWHHYRRLAEIPAPVLTPVALLQRVAAGLERYAAREGHYPRRPTDLYFADPPDLEEFYCDVERDGFRIWCLLSPEGYQVTARPVDPGRDRAASYMISTGEVLTALE